MSEAAAFAIDKWFIVHVAERYFGNGKLFPVIFAIGLLFTLFKQKGKNARLFGWVTVILVLTIYNPLVIKKIVPRFVAANVYYRLLWLLPVTFGAAYYVILLVMHLEKKWMQGAVVAGFVMLCFVTGSANANIKNMTIPTNLYKVPEALVWADEVIHADYTEHEEEIKASYKKFYAHLAPRCVYEDGLEVFAPQYDVSIHLGISRDMRLYYNGSTSVNVNPKNKTYKKCKVILDVVNWAEEADVTVEAFQDAMLYRKVNYLVLYTGKDCHAFLLEAGCEVVDEKDGYTVYRYIGEKAADK